MIFKFDKTNPNHKQAFNHFAYKDNNPEYFISNKSWNASSYEFRQFLSQKFNLTQIFINEPESFQHQIYKIDVIMFL